MLFVIILRLMFLYDLNKLFSLNFNAFNDFFTSGGWVTLTSACHAARLNAPRPVVMVFGTKTSVLISPWPRDVNYSQSARNPPRRNEKGIITSSLCVIPNNFSNQLFCFIRTNKMKFQDRVSQNFRHSLGLARNSSQREEENAFVRWTFNEK